MRRLLTALLGAALLLSACGDDDGARGSAAVTSLPDETSSPTSTTTTTEAPTVAPDVIPQDESQITEEYVEQVLNELYEVSLESVVLTRRDGLVDEAAIGLLESISSPSRTREEINDLIELSAGGFEGYRDELRPVTVDVVDLLERGPECLFAEVRIDNSGYFEQPVPLPPNVRGFARLLPASESQTATGRNPTAWVIDATPATDDGSAPTETCAS